MSTIGYKLNILRDTQMVQRRLLEKQFPYIDWARMPFSSYGDFFRLRGIIDDCGAVWTNAYGRSNGEPDGQRNFLEDYSGNGRDIELFNFGYSKQSGYNGYVQDFRNFGAGSEITNSTITESKIAITNTNISGTNQSVGYITKANYINKGFRIKVSSLSSQATFVFYTPDYSSTVKYIELKEGIIDIPALTDEEWSSFGLLSINIPKNASVVIEQIPNYQGALVSDGIDDYGQCVKDFALPDDYTVVAMRELLNAGPSGIINKTRATGEGAFIFEYGGSQSYSYGDNHSGLTTPKLFSYQTKASYNGTVLTPGTGADTTDDKLLIFRLRDGTSDYTSAALYSFGIFTRTLTEDELRVVENCMYAEWIAMTGNLDDIEYYDILDARFRSNEEDADKRNKWVGRLGKLHMTLNNYAYSGNSGWNGEIGEDGKPLYGGALVSDGVDDNAVSDEVIDEEIGGVVMHCAPIAVVSGNNGYIWRCGGGLGLANYNIGGVLIGGNKVVLGNPWTEFNRNDDEIYGLSRVPGNPIGNLIIGHYTNESASSALYQLRLIKTQPTETQLEAIKWQCRKEHDDYLIHMGWKDETPGWYGVEWDMTDPSPDLKRIGNMQMHRDLPVHVQMRGCLLNDDGVVQKYLNPDDWTSETLDGSAGQVMVQAPVDSYWRFEKDGNICRAKFSPTALPGFKRTPQGFLGSEEATVQRSTNKLCSVVNEDADYRGGNNNSAWDETYRSLLGMPATVISRTNFRTYARNRKSGSTEWNMNEYDLHKLLYWLAVVQYATFNLQKPVNTEKDADGFSQGGLGSGVTTLNYNKWSNFNSVYPFIPCGLTASLGNGSGQVAFTMPFEYDAAPSSATGLEVPYMGEYSAATAYTNGQFVSQGEELYECTADASAGTDLTDTAHFTKVTRTVVYANRYLGVALPFGHIWELSDGVNFRISADTSAGGDGRSQIFTCSDPAKFSDTGYDGYSYIGDAPRANGYVKEMVFGEDGDIVPISTVGSSTTYFCDYWYTAIPASGESLRGVLFGGKANYGASAGLACAHSIYTPSTAFAHVGSRLCFIPA